MLSRVTRNKSLHNIKLSGVFHLPRSFSTKEVSPSLNITSITQHYDDNRQSYFDVNNKHEGGRGNKTPLTKIRNKSRSIGNTIKEFSNDVIWYFLPRGHPESVAANYDKFAIGQVVSTIMGTTCGVLSMQSMLFAIGAGSGSLPLAATLNWIIKDGLGQFGGILFASFVNNRFDADPKRWRMISSISMDISSFLELLTPMCPQYFLPIASIANVGKNISYLSASASRAAIHKSFSLHENLADITVKSGSQSIIGSLIGTGLGLGIAASVGQQYEAVLGAFAVCSILSISSTYASLQYVTITTMSLERLDCLLEDYITKTELLVVGGSGSGSKSSNSSNMKNATVLLSPEELRKGEHLLGAPMNKLAPLFIGTDVHLAIHSNHHFEKLATLFSSDEYIVNCYNSGSNSLPAVHLLYKENASMEDMVKGTTHAYLIRKMIDVDVAKSGGSISSSNKNSEGESDDADWRIDLVEKSFQLMQNSNVTDNFVDLLLNKESKKGDTWLVDPLMLEPRRARISF
jgi:hypothetical protein